ncbi:CIA30 family protein [Photobacterium gaetbulicola]|nr:CIA30 family protein [Photobacterium gaetbulicola]
MIDLTRPSEHQQWQVTNDNVMGGISQGQLTFDGQSSRFWGELSLANNGGFSSISRPLESLSADVDQVELVFIGDGRLYQLRLATWKNGNRITYKHDFSSIEGQRQKHVFELSDFQAVFRGRLIDGAPVLAARDVKQVGVLIADKQPGPFALNLIQLKFKTSQETE